jgi:hypothetical protein
VRTANRIALSTGLALVAAGVLALAGAGADPQVRAEIRAVGSHEASVVGAAAPDAGQSQSAYRTHRAALNAPERAANHDPTARWSPTSMEFPWPAREDDDTADTESADRREASQPPPKRLALDPPRVSEGGLSLRVTGHDARGPRDLVLWRIRGTDAAVVARGRSRRDGALEFPRLVAPRFGLVLVATPAWETPDGPRASPAQIVVPRAPVSPPTAGGGRRGTAVRGTGERAADARNDR